MGVHLLSLSTDGGNYIRRMFVSVGYLFLPDVNRVWGENVLPNERSRFISEGARPPRVAALFPGLELDGGRNVIITKLLGCWDRVQEEGAHRNPPGILLRSRL